MIWPRFLNQLKRHEGCKRDPQTGMLLPYKDTRGIWTGGYGFNFEAHNTPPFPMNEMTAMNLLHTEAHHAVKIARKYFPNFEGLSHERQEVLANMAYNLGDRLGKLDSLIATVGACDYAAAAGRMRVFLWARQVGQRAVELADQMESGESKEPIPAEGV